MNAWVRKQGTADGNTLRALIPEGDGFVFLAFQTDGFESGFASADALDRIAAERLLELRVFDDKEEFLAVRTRIGADSAFHWRTASECGLDENRDYIVRYQTLDINTEKSSRISDANGMRALMSTVGGSYTLPIDGTSDSIRVIAYIEYDENGVAHAVDHRLGGFCTGKEAARNG